MNADEHLNSLLGRPFSANEARAHGLNPVDLRLEDIRQVSRGVFVPGSAPPGLEDLVRAHLAVNPEAWASHRTAGAILGLWLPRWIEDHSAIHLSKPSHLPRVRRPGVVGHRVRILEGELEAREGLRLTSRGRTWLDLGHELTPVALVALGDQLIRVPRPEFEGRGEPYETKASLARLLRAHPKVKGVGKCKEALADMRVGSDSVPESLLRMCLIAHGFPEPELQIRLDPTDPRSPSIDIGYPLGRIGIHYEGGHHLEPEQQHIDLWRDTAFRRVGWDLIHATVDDLHDDFARVRHELRILLSDKAA
ncbi:hypothetical protein RBS60_04920 [Sinomonas sp. ASV486]|uniref:hypothetical protein n=1 Tax=Sinomonas sp. ASV486 TaxID=3051170 RepID=UPI0027DBCA7F|nr:hypothetical protein [Sinomonas sp. ASV486]MDQ4489540.1 hypothetical protein [Sinomonas sp. ASV486]